MSKPAGRRDQKKAETRLAISNVATQLFVERGFENVSVAEIASVAGVSRKTVFNHFLRKEDLMFDREEDLLALVQDALSTRGTVPPVTAFQALMRDLLQTGHPVFRITERPIAFWRTVSQSPALTTRARELQVLCSDELAGLLAAAIDQAPHDAEARLAGAMLVATVVVAYGDALRALRENANPTEAFVRTMERGFGGVDAALTGTAYVEPR